MMAFPRPGEVWWLPKDWLAKALWTGLFTAVASFVIVLAWVYPLSEAVPATVERLDEGTFDATTVAWYGGDDRRQFPFLEQVIERAEANGGRVDTLFPERAWNGWIEQVQATQPGADPRLVTDGKATYRLTER